MDASKYFDEIVVKPHLVGIEGIPDSPLTFSDIAGARIFYGLLFGAFDTSTCIVWSDHHFKVASHVAWREVQARYLEDSAIGKIISIVPALYGGLQVPEFCLVHPSDRPDRTYAVYSTRVISGKNYSVEDICKMGGGVLGEGMASPEEAKKHPLLLAVFGGDKTELDTMVDFLSEIGEWETGYPLATYITDPQRSSLLLLNSGGKERNFDIEAGFSFAKQKHFLRPKKA